MRTVNEPFVVVAETGYIITKIEAKIGYVDNAANISRIGVNSGVVTYDTPLETGKK